MMDFLSKARKLESTIARRLDNVARELIRSGAREPIEIVNLIVEAVEHQIQPGGRGRHVFPFNRIAVSIVAPSRDARARVEAIVDGQPPLRDRIVERLTTARCDVPNLVVDVAYVTRPQKAWKSADFHLDFQRQSPDRLPGAQPFRAAEEHEAAKGSQAPIELSVLLGTAERTTYSLAADRIDLGRSVEIRDLQHRLIRMNHVAFLEQGGDVNQTVSRQHAHITCDARSGHYRLHDDRSAHGTSVIRNGRSISVPGGSHGVRLRNGDEIVLGDARLRVTLRG
jgi:hypothetical protein